MYENSRLKSWKTVSRHRGNTKRAAERKRFVKRVYKRLNRRIGRQLETYEIPYNNKELT